MTHTVTGTTGYGYNASVEDKLNALHVSTYSTETFQKSHI